MTGPPTWTPLCLIPDLGLIFWVLFFLGLFPHFVNPILQYFSKKEVKAFVIVYRKCL